MEKKRAILDTEKAANKHVAAQQKQYIFKMSVVLLLPHYRAHKRKLEGEDGGRIKKKSKKGVSRKAAPKPARLMKQRAKKKGKRK